MTTKTALITGSARGIGASTAKILSNNGYKIILNYNKSKEKAEKLHEEINQKNGKCIVVAADVTNREQAEYLVERGIEEFGNIDVLVNNTGDFLFKSINNVSKDDWENMFNSNLYSCIYCTESVLPGMRRNNWGRIINLGVSGIEKANPRNMMTPYFAAKSAVLHYTRALAQIEGKNGITINMVSPGYIDCGNYTEEFIEETRGKIPLGKLGKPEDIAETILFLAGVNASYINGANIEIDGGAEI